MSLLLLSLRRRLVAFEAAVLGGWQRLDRPAVLSAAMLCVPLLFGLMSLALGQDDNWDLHNYHFYNPYALLNGKIGYDLAPGQWQSYFNPTLDLLYYGLVTTLPAPLAGFIMGCLHGLNFVLVLALARRLLPPRSHRLGLLLALAGCLGPGFLSELGNSMGDNLTSLCVLGALLLLLRQWPRLAAGGAIGTLLLAGLLAGAGCGLKLTNATYALAMCLALFILPGSFLSRFRAAFVFGLGVLGGIAVSAGHWYWRMWQVFGNPLFPQFNDKFHAALAMPIGIGDTGWLPKGLGEHLLWPFIFTLHSQRVIEVPMTQLIWPMVYLAFLALALRLAYAAALGRPAPAPEPEPATAEVSTTRREGAFVLMFFALSYIAWLNLFGIYRYLVPIELLAPLALWLVAQRLMQPGMARGVAGYGLLLATLVVFPPHNWGHGHWTRAAASAQVPAMAEPSQSMVLTVHGDPPMSWLVPFFPRALAFVALGSGFPESPAYAERMAAMMAQRHGPVYVMLQADRRDPADTSPEAVRVAAEQNAGVLERGGEILARYRLNLDAGSCRSYPAYIGSNRWPYQLCLVTHAAP